LAPVSQCADWRADHIGQVFESQKLWQFNLPEVCIERKYKVRSEAKLSLPRA
jgi:hypothetical protein